MKKDSLVQIWQESNSAGREVHGYFDQDGNPVVTQIGTATDVLVDVRQTNTFHTHPDTPNTESFIIEFAGCDPPSGQDIAVLLTRYNANGAPVNTDTVVSRYGIWTYSMKSQLFDNNPCLSYRDGLLLRSYYQWLQMLILSGFFSVDQYTKWVQKLDPVALSTECEDFLSQGEEAHKYVYAPDVYNKTFLFPLNEENTRRYTDLDVQPSDISIERRLWTEFV